MKAVSLGDAFDHKANNFHAIRLLAALAVIYGHSYALTGSQGGDIFLRTVGFKFIGGVAVDIFFALSGFLISASLSRSTVRHYITSRCLRIFPALTVALVICTFVLGPIVTTEKFYFNNPQTWNYFFSNLLMTHTEYRLPGVFEELRDNGVNGSLWSLPIEFRLYFIMLLISLTGLLRRERFATFAIICMLVGLYASTRCPWLIAYNNWLDASAFFLAGCYLWVYRYEVILSYWGVIFFLGAAVALHGSAAFYVAYFAVTCYLLFFLAFCMKFTLIRRTDISYGVYLYGWPVQQCVISACTGQGAMFNTVVSGAITIVIASLSWQFIERPMLKLKSRRAP
jgi:peptidoglycan/LPS O-acetylase OafA/YrhL